MFFSFNFGLFLCCFIALKSTLPDEKGELLDAVDLVELRRPEERIIEDDVPELLEKYELTEEVLVFDELRDDFAPDVVSVLNADLRFDRMSLELEDLFVDCADRLSVKIPGDELLNMLGSVLSAREICFVLTDFSFCVCAVNGLLFGNALAANGLPP